MTMIPTPSRKYLLTLFLSLPIATVVVLGCNQCVSLANKQRRELKLEDAYEVVKNGFGFGLALDPHIDEGDADSELDFDKLDMD